MMTLCSLLLTATLPAAEPPLNPIVTDFSRELTFHLDFDDGTIQPAVGKTTIGRDKRDLFRMEDSALGGKALVNGIFGYPQDPNAPLLDTSKPGTIICWVKLNREVKPRREGLLMMETGSTFFDVVGGGGQLLIMKDSHLAWGSGALVFYAGWKDPGGKLRTASVSARSSLKDWKVGEWRMVAASWTAEKMYISVNGRPSASSPLVQPLPRYPGGVYVTATHWSDANPKSKTVPGLFAIDEVSILNRKLTDAEIKSIYDKMSARLHPSDGGLARAFRGTWIATVYDPRFSEDLSEKSIDGIKAYWRSMLDAAARVNVNAVIFQTRPCADAFYKGSLEPWSLHLRGKQGKAPEGGFDPLQFMIDECHARGMQLHALFNPFRVTYNEGDEKKLAADHNYFKHPDWFVKYGKSVYYDPGVPACRDWTVKVILDVVARYDLDGIHIDDYFYPYRVIDAKGADVPFPDEKSFAKFGGGFTDVNAWRDNNSDLLVKEIATRLRALKPDVIFGVAPFNDNGYCLKYLHCDSLKWAKNGWVDYLIPQLYYGENCRDKAFWWDAHADGCPLFAGRFLKNLNCQVDHGPRKGMSELDNMLQMHDQMTNLTGVCWWSAHVMMLNTSNVTDRLAPHYVQKTLVPLYRNRPRTPPASVVDARADVRDGLTTLTWRHPGPSEGRPKALFTAVFRGNDAHPEVVTDKTSVSLEAKPGETFRLVALDRLQNAAAPTVVRVGEALGAGRASGQKATDMKKTLMASVRAPVRLNDCTMTR